MTIMATAVYEGETPEIDPNAAKSVLGKAKLIIEAFTTEDAELSLAELVRRTGIAKATVHRLAHELIAWGVLERSGSAYRLGLRLFEIGQRVPRQRILRDAALPFMEDLLLATQETVHLAIPDGLDVLYVEKLICHRGLTKQSRVAGRLPLFCTATGKVILAFSPDSLLDSVAKHGLKPITRHTLTSMSRLRTQLDKVRQDHLAVEQEEIRPGYSSVAVPVFGHSSTLVGAVSITAPTFRLNAARISPALRAAGIGISRALQSMV